MSDPRTDHGQKLGNGSARARSPSPARAAALARRDNEVACPYLRALIKRQTRELPCCGVLFWPLRPYFFFFASGPRRPRHETPELEARGERHRRDVAPARHLTGRRHAGRGSSTSSSRGAGRSRTGRGGRSRRIYAARRSRRPRRRCRRRPRRPSCSRAGRSTAGGASSSSSATCRSGAASSCVPASLGPCRVSELSTQVCPGIDHGRIAFFVAFWERRGSGVPCLLDGDASPVASRAGSTARRTGSAPC
mgnify:CR=1 FL=1